MARERIPVVGHLGMVPRHSTWTNIRAIGNVSPFAWEWDTRSSPNGEHTIEIQGFDLQGKLINSTTSKVVVAN